MKPILTWQPYYQHPVLRSSCRLWDSTDYTPVSLSIFETELHIVTWLDFSRRRHRHHTHAPKFSISSFEATESFYSFFPVMQQCNVCVNNISHTAAYLLWNGPEHRWLIWFLFFIVVFWSHLPGCIYCLRWLTDCCFITDCCWNLYITWYINYSLQAAYTVL